MLLHLSTITIVTVHLVPDSSICDVNSCGVNIDICSIGSIECAGCYGDDLLVPSSGMLGSCIGGLFVMNGIYCDISLVKKITGQTVLENLT